MNREQLLVVAANGKIIAVCRGLWQWVMLGLVVAAVFWLGGCASQPKTQEYLDARVECEKNAAPAHGMMVSIVYHHCMEAKGFRR